MKPPFFFGLAIVCLLTSASASETGSEIRSRIAQAKSEHPRLLLRRGEETLLRQKIESNPVLVTTSAYVVTVADQLMKVPPVQRIMTGTRLLDVSRRCLKRVLHLGYAYRLTGKEVYAERAQREMLAAAAFTDWNPSNFLDVAEMTSALAIGYDWLYDYLDPASRAKIKGAIIEKALKPSLKGQQWVAWNNNWNQVCHGGMTLGSLAVMEDEPELAASIIERAIANVPRAMTEYGPDGGYSEGPMYWNYGTSYNALLIAALESALGTDFKLSEWKVFLDSSDYYFQMTGPTGLFFNYSDCVPQGDVSPVMYWFAAKREKSSLLFREREILTAFLKQKHRPDFPDDGFLPLLVIWAPVQPQVQAPNTLHQKFEGTTPIGIHRSGWRNRNEAFVGLKGGSPATSHGHMDIGSFVMDALGVRWAEDLGMENYTQVESKGVKLWDSSQNGQRWDVFRLSNLSHNTLVVDGQKQWAKGHASIIGFSDERPMPHTIIDMSPVYHQQLTSAKRGVGMLPDGSVLIQDEIETLERETSIRWAMATQAEVSLGEDRIASLRQKLDGSDRQLVMQILTPLETKFESFEIATPKHNYDSANKGARMIGFNVTIPPSTKAKIVVLLTPSRKRNTEPEVGSLAEW